jgi:hypothetical protein
MRAPTLLAPLASACLALAAAAWSHAVPPGDGAMGAGAVLPADVRMSVRARDIRGMRADGTLAPAQAALVRLAGSRVLGDAWMRIAGALGTDGTGLVDLLLGTDVIYAERARDGGTDWVIVTHTAQATYDLLVKRLAPTVEGGGRVTFGEQGVAAAWRPPYLVLGPSARHALLDAVVERLDAPKRLPGLADDPVVADAASWERGAVEATWRHDAPVDGASVFVVRPVQGDLRVRHRSRWARAPIHVAPGAAADAGLLRALEGQGIAVLAMNPWRGALDPNEPMDALLLEGEVDDAMRANMGARQVVVVGERAVAGSRLRVPTIGLAFEVRDPVLAERQWEGWARRLVDSLVRRTGLPGPEPFATAGDDGVRRSAIGPLVRSLLADHPLVPDVELAWDSATTQSNGAWQLVATDPALLRTIRDALATAPRAPDADGAHEVGVLSGRALAAHLRSWATEASRFAPEQAESFASAIGLAADVAAAATTVRWRARAPDANVVESEIVVELPKASAPAAAPAGTVP